MNRIYILLFIANALLAAELTIGSFNMGGLKDHYDYYRAVAMADLTAIRDSQMPELQSSFNALHMQAVVGQERGDIQSLLHAGEKFGELAESYISPFQIRPIKIHEQSQGRLLALMGASELTDEGTELWRKKIARAQFANMPLDIIALQEVRYFTQDMLSDDYDVIIEKNGNGVAWRKDKLNFVQEIGRIDRRGLAVQFEMDGMLINFVSAHLTGCNPFEQVRLNGEVDSVKGDRELAKLIEMIKQFPNHINVIAMDANVTAFHPRYLHFISEFQVDTQHLYPTNTNPNVILDTRLDWIGAGGQSLEGIENLPLADVLNQPDSNCSDHVPIASKVLIKSH